MVGLPELLGREYAVTTSVGGLGFTGIAIALLGRNNPIGIAFAALLWAFLDRTKIILDLEDIPQETIVIMQGVTVLAVVIAYELAARVTRRQQQRSVGVATGEADGRHTGDPGRDRGQARRGDRSARPSRTTPGPVGTVRRRARTHDLRHVADPVAGRRSGRGPVKSRKLSVPAILHPGRGRADRAVARAGDHRGRRPHLGRRHRRRAGGRRPDRTGRPRRAVVGAGRRGQHRPRGHDDPRDLGRRLGRARVRGVGRHPVRRGLRRAGRAAARAWRR